MTPAARFAAQWAFVVGLVLGAVGFSSVATE